MNSSDQELFDVFSFEAEARRLRQTAPRSTRTPFSQVRVPSQHTSDDDMDEDDADMEEEDRDGRGSTENHVQDLDPDEKATEGIQALVNMHSHTSQSSSTSRSRTSPVVWSPNTDIPTPPSSSLPSNSPPPSPSPSHRFTGNMTALDILNWLWGDELYQHLAHHTNLYAQHKQQQQQQQDSKWEDVTADEIRTLFGMFAYMSIVKLPAFNDYWSTNAYLSTPIIRNVMPRDRAHKILQYLHANHPHTNTTNNNNQQVRDPLHTIEPILTHLTRSFMTTFECGQRQSIDELMIAYRGRTHFIQYMPKKRVRYGIKVWCRADSESAFISQFQINFSKQQQNTTQQTHTTSDIINTLTYHIMNRSYHLFFDNYFTTIDNLKMLQQNGIYATGTVRTSRTKFPQEFLDRARSLRHGESIHASTDGISGFIWRDKKLVSFLSTAYPASTSAIIQQRSHSNPVNTEQVSAPIAVQQYRLNMNGVDRFASMLSRYECDFKTRKWWVRVLWYVFDMSIVNAYIMSTYSPHAHHHHRSIKHFRLALAEQLIGGRSYCKKIGRPRTNPLPSHVVVGQHFIENAGRRCDRLCVVCRRKRTVYQCKQCQAHMCLEPCFEHHHTP